MATKPKASSSSCLSFLKDALLLPTRNAKLFISVFLLFAIPTFLLQIPAVFRINEIDHIDNMEDHASSADYGMLMENLKTRTGFVLIATAVVVIIIVVMLAFVHSFTNQIVAFFAASTTYSGDRFSLPELFSKVITKGRRLRGPLITVVMVSILGIVCKVPLAALSLPVMPHLGLGALYMTALSALPFLAFLYLDVACDVSIAVSVADTKCRGVSALLQAWRLMTRVWRKEGFELVMVHYLEKVLSSPLHRLALVHLKKSMPMGLALLSVYALLSSFMKIFYFTAATVYYYQAMKSVKSKEVMAP